MNLKLSKSAVRIMRDSFEHYAENAEDENDVAATLEYKMITNHMNTLLSDDRQTIALVTKTLIQNTTDYIINTLTHEILTNEDDCVDAENAFYDYVSIKYCYNVEEQLAFLAKATTEEAISYAIDSIDKEYNII